MDFAALRNQQLDELQHLMFVLRVETVAAMVFPR